MSWINLHALWKILVVGLICGAGLPALFAVGLRALGAGEHSAMSEGGAASVTRHPAAVLVAGLCFAVVLAAIGWGIYLIVDGT